MAIGFVFAFVFIAIGTAKADYNYCSMNNDLPSEDAVRAGVNSWNKNGTPTFAGLSNEAFSPDNFINSAGLPEKSALCFIDHYPGIFKLNDSENELQVLDVKKDSDSGQPEIGMTHVKFDRVYKGLTVFGSQLVFHFNKSGAVSSFNGRYHPSFDISIEPKISESQAIAIAESSANYKSSGASAKLIIFTQPDKTDYLLSWDVNYPSDSFPTATYIVDANNGNILDSDNGIRNSGTGGIVPGAGSTGGQNSQSFFARVFEFIKTLFSRIFK